VRGLAAGLEIEDAVTSPTYTLMHSYPGRLELFHFDAWMEGREAAFLEGGGAEWFTAGGVSVVEWASRVPLFLPADHLEVRLFHVGALGFDEEGQVGPDQKRRILLVAHGPDSEALLAAVSTYLEPLSGGS
jgi:tRNA A37 threonylcarbamoyladenosine biosynthesis protein TsaE